MAYTVNNGVRIHYKVEGNGAPLVLIHGFGGSLHDWYDFGYVKELKNSFSLILIDSRGHGLSDKLYDSDEYNINLRATDVISVINDLNINKFHFLGYSSGATVGFSLIEHFSDRLISVILGGNHPYESEKGIEYMYNMFSKGLDYFVEILENNYGSLQDKVKDRLLGNDQEALLSAIPKAWPGFTHILSNITIPCMFYIGDRDEGIKAKLEKALIQIPKYRIINLTDTDHWQGYTRSELILPYIFEFLKE